MQRDSTYIVLVTPLTLFSSNDVMQRSDALAWTALALVMRGAIRVDKRGNQSDEEQAYVGGCLHLW